MQIKTHYDNLNVDKNAPSDVIRSAYKAIIQRCEADLSPKADASRFLKAINDSFAVLSNPVQRSEYDQWLLEQESAIAENKKAKTNTTSKRKVNTSVSNTVSKPDVAKLTSNPSESISSPDKKTPNLGRWLIYAGVFVLIVLASTWFGIFADKSENKDELAAQSTEPVIQQEAISTASSTQNVQSLPIAENTQNTAMVVATNVPDHDQVTINKFIGLWKGSNGETGAQQTLDISLKSEHSFVFNLDAKAGKSVGGVYGIAEFANSYANFYNKEYNCSILFTIKSDVLQLNTSNCKAYHESGIAFDGSYSKSSPAKVDTKQNVAKSKTVAKSIPAKINQAETIEASPVVVVNAPKLLKFVVTVKDATGKTSKIELIAKDKEAARAIIRDFRGNPDVLKIKEVRK